MVTFRDGFLNLIKIIYITFGHEIHVTVSVFIRIRLVIERQLRKFSIYDDNDQV